MANVPFIDDRIPIDLHKAADGPLLAAGWISDDIETDNFRDIEIGISLNLGTDTINEIQILIQSHWDYGDTAPPSVLGTTLFSFDHMHFSFNYGINAPSMAQISESPYGGLLWDTTPLSSYGTMNIRVPVLASYFSIVCSITDPLPFVAGDNTFKVSVLRRAK